MIPNLYNSNKTLNINQMILLDYEDEINIEENKEKENIQTIITFDVDFKVHNNRKKYMKDLKNKIELDNLSQMFSTDILVSNNDKKLKKKIKKIKDKEIKSSKPINRKKILKQ